MIWLLAFLGLNVAADAYNAHAEMEQRKMELQRQQMAARKGTPAGEFLARLVLLLLLASLVYAVLYTVGRMG